MVISARLRFALQEIGRRLSTVVPPAGQGLDLTGGDQAAAASGWLSIGFWLNLGRLSLIRCLSLMPEVLLERRQMICPWCGDG